MTLRKHRWAFLALPNILLLMLFFIWPLLYILLYSIYTYDPFQIFIRKFTWENYVKVLTNDLYVNAIFNTFQLAIIVTFFVIIMAYPVAYYLARTKSKTEDTIISFMILAPVLISVVTTSFSWVILLSPFGTLYRILNALNLIDGPLRIMFTKTGIIIGLTYGQIAYMVMTLRSALSNIDWSLIKAAKVLGASPARAFYEITLPLSLPGVFFGAIVTFSLSLSSFVTPYLLGSRLVKVMSIFIYDNIVSVYNWPLGSATATVLFIITTILLGLITYIFEKRLFGWLKY